MSDQGNFPPQSRGFLMANRTKSLGSKQPDMKGKMDITNEQLDKLIEMRNKGIEMSLQVSAWHAKSKSGNDYISLSCQAFVPRAKNEPSQGGPYGSGFQQPGGGRSNTAVGFDDDIPF